MAGMSVSTGLISGIDYDSMIGSLMQVEANPQTLLKNQLVAVQADAAAYRAVNTRFDALRTAAAALTAPTAWTAVKASSSNATVTTSAGGTAVGGSVSFTVNQLAATHSEISDAKFATTDTGFGSSTFSFTSNGTTTDIPITTTNAAGATLADAVAAINASGKGLTAAAVKVQDGEYRLQVTATASGKTAGFTVGNDTGWTTVTTGRDAELSLGEGTLKVYSSTNTFTGLMADTSITVSKAGEAATVTVTKDPSSAAAKMKSLVDAANGLLDSVTSYTDTKNENAILKGDSTLRGLANQILSVFSGGYNGTLPTGSGGPSASNIGVSLTKDGKLAFDSAVFTAKLASNPDVVKDMVGKRTSTSPGADLVSGNADDAYIPLGFAAQLEALAKGASDSTSGTLVMLANSGDSTIKDLTTRIDAWDTRLALRKDSLTRQFNAMEKALGTLQNQGAWLSSQIAGLPSWSKSN